MPTKYEFTATSRTGQKVNQITGGPSDSISVYSDAELKQRTVAAKSDPRDLDVQVRRLK